jgi:exopolyphosphatase/guanosine-5'-triphosphate,3'-diphosphate pyrophosphatase
MSSAAPADERVPEFAAAVDLGSNSFHMIVGRLSGGQLQIVDRIRERVRLASGLDADDNIRPEAMERALATLGLFGQRLSDMPAARVRVVGTNTLRKARNSKEFMARAREALGHPIEIIDGREEARLIYLGVAQTMSGVSGRRLVVDIGGGSTEFIIGDGFDIKEADSLFMGCVSFSLRYFPDGRITQKGFRDAQLAAKLELQSIVRPYTALGWSSEVGCSGTVHAIARIVTANGWSDEGITLRSLRKLRKALIAAGDADELSLAGLVDDRKPVIAGGAAILEALFTDLNVERMVPSPGALREGVLYDLVGRIRHEDVRDRTIRWFCDHYHVDQDQAAQMTATASALLDQASKGWQLPVEQGKRLLGWAARLSEVGLAISHTGYHRHSAYLVENSHMAGFARGEQRILGAMVRSHRRRLRPSNFELVDGARRDEVVKMTLVLRLAAALHRGRGPLEVPCTLKVKRQKMKLTFPEGWIDDHPLTHVVLKQEAGYVKELGYELAIKHDPPAD